MRSLIVTGATALMIIGGTGLVSAQTAIQPGQLATAPRIHLPNDDTPTNASGAMPKTTIANPEDPHDRFMNRLWIASMFAAVAGSTADAASSWGKREGNSLLASSNGTFGAKGASIKAGIAAAVIIPQICMRKHKDMKGVFVFGNFAEAAVFAGAAVHNLHIQSAPATQ